MCMALQSKQKLGFIDGLIPMPNEDPNKEDEWWEVNTLVGSWILNTIEPTLRTSINYSERVDELWMDLKEHFLHGNGPRKYELKAALANCKQAGTLWSLENLG